MKKQITLLITILLTTCMFAFAQTNVKGIVADSKGTPIPGATVKVKETGKAAATDINGNYTIAAAPNSTLVISSVGYTTQEIRVNNRTTVNITLNDDSKQLTDVVVIGYGTRAVKDVTGAITSIKAEKYESENPTSVTDLIKGNAPGISVGLTTSPKGGGAGDLLVRGSATLTGNKTPLIVLDGVIFTGVIADINPNDIERVDILKDPSALAVYGSVSAAGVVAITTKKGKLGAPQISFNANYGITELAKDQKFYQGDAFLGWRADAARATNVANPYYFYSDPRNLPAGVTLAQFLGASTGDPVNVWLGRLGLQQNEINNFNAGRTIDWSKLVFQKGRRQDYTGSLSGKTENVSYYMSGNFTRNESEIVGDKYTNYRFRVNLEGKASKFLTFGVNAQYALRDEPSNYSSVNTPTGTAADWKQIINSSPYGDFYNVNGSGQLTRIDTDDSGLNQRNPLLAYTYNQSVHVQNTLFASLFAKVRLPFGIQYQLSFNPDIEAYRDFTFKPLANPDENATVGGEGSRTMENRYKYNIDNLLTWNKTFGIHNFDVTLLLNKEKYETWYTSTSNTGFLPNDLLSYHAIQAGTLPVLSSDDRVANGDAILGRLNYTLLGKYILTASMRRDGYSPFGLKFPRSTYPSGALAWVITDEQFVKESKALSWLNYGKLRVSYGVNGNRPAQGTIDPLIALALVNVLKYPTSTSAGTVTNNPAAYGSTLQNNELKWERTTGTNIGLDFTILNNRISGSIDLYNRSTKDLLVNRALLQVQGFDANGLSGLFNLDKSFAFSNIGEVNNKGFEIAISTKNYQSKNLVWNSSINFAVNRNKIVHLYGPVTTTDAAGNTSTTENDDRTNGWFIGRDINAVWDYKIIGVWQADELAEAAKYTLAGIKPGDFKLEDVNGDHVYTDADKQFLGTTTPQFQWSVRNDFTFFKHFDFSFLLVSNMGQLGQFNEAKNSPGSVGFLRQSSYVIPYWTADNPLNDYARLASGSNGTSFNVWRSTSFVRINTISIGYTLDKQFVKRFGVQSAKVFANANNAYVFTNYPFWDPQNAGGGAGPTPRIITAGVSVTF
jgi:TonB-linked SusC/RagA family outer membrane protein